MSKQAGVLAVLFAGSLAGMLAACGGGSPGPPPPPPPPPLAITTTLLADGVVNVAYSQLILLSNAIGGVTYSIASGALPPGIVLSAAGILAGAPLTTGSFNFTVQVRDASGATATRSLTIRVSILLSIDTTFLSTAAAVGRPYSLVLKASGGASPITWSLVGGTLPPGLTLSAAGMISGTPTTPGTSTFNLQVADASSPPQQSARQFTIRVVSGLAISTLTLPPGVAGQPYHFTLQAVGGTPPYTWSLSLASLGLMINPATGEITGTPQQEASGAPPVQVVDSSNPPQMVSAVLNLSIAPRLAIITPNLADGVQGAPYPTSNIQVSGGTAPYILGVSSGGLPSGVTIVATNPGSGSFLLTGTPTDLGTFAVTLQVTDTSSPPLTSSRSYTFHINTQLVITTTSLPPGMEGQAYNASLVGTGGAPPYNWQVSGSGLPPGLTLNPSTGQISGTPSAASSVTTNFLLSDSASPPQMASARLTFNIVGVLRITTSALPPVAASAPLQILLGLTGGTPPITWSLIAGALPAGLALNASTGAIAGTPIAAGPPVSFTLKVVDSGTGSFAQTASRALSLTVKILLGRNETPATATPLSNGTYQASISPYADPVTGPANPDVDVYAITANPGAIVSVETFAQRLSPPSSLDTVIDIMDKSGNRLNLCSQPPGPSGPFNQPCLNDDIKTGVLIDSKLFLQVPAGSAGPLTFFVRVLDFRGDARPDLIYDISVVGSN